MKKNILSVIALVLAAAALAVALFAYTKPVETTDYSAQIEALEAHNALLQSQLDALTAQLSSTTQGTGLSGWDLALTPWETGTGASVTLTATPANYAEGMTAALSIRLNGKEVRNVPCSWTGDAFTATAELAAEDGYGYYCILIDAQGSKQQFALTTPENPVSDVPVYLASALEAYCNLLVDSWYDADGLLTISLAYAQAQLPRLSMSGDLPTIEKAELQLYYNGAEYSTLPITLEAAEGQGAYALTIAGEVIEMPEMAEDEYLDLYLKVTLSDGQELTALGASWYCNDGGLFAVMG